MKFRKGQEGSFGGTLPLIILIAVVLALVIGFTSGFFNKILVISDNFFGTKWAPEGDKSSPGAFRFKFENNLIQVYTSSGEWKDRVEDGIRVNEKLFMPNELKKSILEAYFLAERPKDIKLNSRVSLSNLRIYQKETRGDKVEYNIVEFDYLDSSKPQIKRVIGINQYNEFYELKADEYIRAELSDGEMSLIISKLNEWKKQPLSNPILFPYTQNGMPGKLSWCANLDSEGINVAIKEQGAEKCN